MEEAQGIKVDRITTLYPQKDPDGVFFDAGDRGCKGWATVKRNESGAFDFCINTVGPENGVYYSEATYTPDQLAHLGRTLLALSGQ